MVDGVVRVQGSGVTGVTEVTLLHYSSTPVLHDHSSHPASPRPATNPLLQYSTQADTRVHPASSVESRTGRYRFLIRVVTVYWSTCFSVNKKSSLKAGLQHEHTRLEYTLQRLITLTNPPDPSHHHTGVQDSSPRFLVLFRVQQISDTYEHWRKASPAIV